MLNRCDMRKNIFFLIFVLLFLNLISAINLEINSKQISNSIIVELNDPAVFELTITNLEQADTFEIYSLIGIEFSPKTIFIDSNKTKTIKIEVFPQTSIKSSRGSFPFEYNIKDSENNFQKQQLVINIMELKQAILIIPEPINPGTENIKIQLKNKATHSLDNLKLKLTSAFFNYEKTFSLNSSETINLNIPIESEKTKSLNAGQYLIKTQIELEGIKTEREDMIKFLKQEDIETIESEEGFIKKRNEIIKRNIGNVEKTIKITAKKNLISFLFTTLNKPTTDSEIKGFTKIYTWEKILIPGEEIKIIITTNWFFPIIIIILIIIIIFFVKKSIETDLSLRKKVTFVKTKGGQFALKITLRVKSKRFLERINVIDKLPHLVKLYDKFGSIHPDKIDIKNRRLEWNIENLSKDEERIFTYIIYSRIGVVGRFELPSAFTTYEKEGKLKRTVSNRSFFINEPKSY